MKLTIAREYARKMRKNPTPAEAVFWEKFRAKRIVRYRLRRQHIFQYRDDWNNMSCFIVDFYWPQKDLVIEIDGKYHDTDKQTMADEERDRILMESFGKRVARFSNEQVLGNWAAVENRVLGLMG
ncbi:MAG: endonuclease domain-containing protein [Bacteroidota bacterium]